MPSKKELDYMTELYTEKSIECKHLKTVNEKLQKEKRNLLSLMLVKKVHMIVSTYTILEDEHIIYISNFRHKGICTFDIDFVSQNLSASSFNSQPEAKANVEVINDIMKIVRIDAKHFRLHHGGILLTQIEKYAKANEIKKIWGDVDDNTPIGVDNLIKFYQNHGYQIYKNALGTHFKKILQQK